jgi:transposase
LLNINSVDAICLAHLLRVARDRHRTTTRHAEGYTLKQYHADLDRRLDRIMAGVLIPGSSPGTEPGRKLRKRIAANRSPFVFVTNRSVPYTNNVSERGLRPSVIFRKVTNGFRCEWGAETSAAFRSVVSTANANRASVLAVLKFVLAAKLPVQTLAEAG